VTTRRCTDPACLYSSRGAAEPPAFKIVTTETREGRGLWEACTRCGLVVNRSGVDPTRVDEFYNAEYVQKNSYTSGELLSARQHFDQRLETIRVIAHELEPYLSPTMRVFELGAATGELLYLIRDKVKYCFANEINQLYAEFIRTDLGIDASHDDYLTIEFPEKFDAIVSINTVDHMANPRRVLEKIYNDLKPGGILYIEVPNDSQALNRYLSPAKQAAFTTFMYQKAHYYSFSFSTLAALVEQVGFHVERKTSRHDYTLNNFLNWYFRGYPQSELKTAMLETDLFAGDSPFEMDMNALFGEFNVQFKRIMADHKVGEIICMIARKAERVDA
jgi:SAM-dependent methyltransferase